MPRRIGGRPAASSIGPTVPTPWLTTASKFFCVIHDMEGYYEASISYLNRCDTNTGGDYNVSASVHYLVNSVQNGSGENNPTDPVAGDITQSVRESHFVAREVLEPFHDRHRA